MTKETKRNWLTAALILTLILLTIGVFLSYGYAQDCSEQEKGIELVRTVVVETPEGVESTQPSVTFSHLGHAMEYGCAACHHKWELESDSSPAKCFDCHNNTEERTGKDSYFAAFHDRQAETSCLGCHASVNLNDEAAEAPIRCNDCHIRD